MTARCSHCDRPFARLDVHLAACTSAPQRTKSRTARRKGVLA